MHMVCYQVASKHLVVYLHSIVEEGPAQYSYVLKMNGIGTQSAWTGLDFGCRFTVQYLGPLSQPSEPSLQNLSPCNCDLHIDMPLSGGNTWTPNCACLAPWVANTRSGQQVTMQDIVWHTL